MKLVRPIPLPSVANAAKRDMRAQSKELQRQLAKELRLQPGNTQPQLIGACDVGYQDGGYGDRAFAVVVVVDRDNNVLEQVTWVGKPPMPYMPGLFAWREAGCLIPALEKLTIRPDVLLCDAQGTAHPRGFGLACHIGLAFDLPTIGVAKNWLFGDFAPPGPEPGVATPLTHAGNVIGHAFRSAKGAPVFVSPGHHYDCESALDTVRDLRGPTRVLPAIRVADLLTGVLSRPKSSAIFERGEGDVLASGVRWTKAMRASSSSGERSERTDVAGECIAKAAAGKSA